MAEEAGVEVVAAEHVGGRGDVDGATGVGVGSVSAQSHVLAWFYERGVGEEGIDDTTEHDGTAGVGHEVTLVFLFVLGAEAFDFSFGEAKLAADVYEILLANKALAKG